MNTRVSTIGWLVVVGIGCSDGDKWTEDLPETVEATGIVLLDGDPVKGASIVFAPSDGATYPAKAYSDDDGEFELQAFPSKPGAVPGKYKVQISKTAEIPVEPVAATGPDAAHALEGEGGDTRYINALPQQYANSNTSGLTADIPQGGVDDLKFELVSK